jgi:hypothetical protein
MPEIRTRDEALVAVDRGLAQWGTTMTGVLTQAAAMAGAARNEADSAVRRQTTKLAALQAQRASMPPEADTRAIDREIVEAQARLRTAQQAAARVADVVQKVGVLQRNHARSAETQIGAARADLSRRGGHLTAYRASGGGGGNGSGGSSSSSGTGTPWLSGTGLSDVDVTAADFSDNPILGSFGRGDTSRADYRWAVETWDGVVRPGLARGMTRADFEARDAQRGAAPLRRTAAVYDMFLGDTDRLRLSRKADGSLNVTNGRHRIEIARELGISNLPAQVIEP